MTQWTIETAKRELNVRALCLGIGGETRRKSGTRWAVGCTKAELDTPALCLDLEAVESNIQRMADYFRELPVRLRPQVETHMSPEVARMQMAAGAVGITCARLGEAEVMAAAGLKDILIASPVVGAAKIERLVDLATDAQVTVAVDDEANVRALGAAARARGVTLRVLIQVNIGTEGCGVEPGEPALHLARRVFDERGLRFDGIMGLEGHVAQVSDPIQRETATEDSLLLLIETADLLTRGGIPVGTISSGATGTYYIAGCYPGINELRVGSYVTMDDRHRREAGIDFACGLTVLATVISTRGNDRAIIDAGLKAMTRDYAMPLVVKPGGWKLTGVSEESGQLERMGGRPLKAGDKVEIVPDCGPTTINLHDEYCVLRGDVLEAVWPIDARGKVS